ncbi:hypothetical protein [Microbacterium deminutum]|uniref:Uncharacterized protein n=1 Tax=Microbacterium deminutum TaxID=344164 RepID=A0ABP5BL67_9MICO
MSEPDTVDLEAELTALRVENEALRTGQAVPPDEVAPAAAARAGWWRALLSAVCIVVAAILVPVSIVGAWARVQLVDEDTFVATLAPLVGDPAVQDMIIDESMQAIRAQVDFQQITSDVFDGIAGLGLPPRAADALKRLEQPAANGLESLVTTTVTRVVRSDAFAEVWATATRAAHRALVGVSTSDGGGLVVQTDQGVGIQLGAVVERVKQNLIDAGVGVAQLIPTIDKVVIIGSGENLTAIRTGYALATTLGYWLPFITLALFGLGILIARRRSTAVLGTGIGFAVGGAALAIGLSIGATVVGISAGSLGLSAAALEVIYEQLIGNMTQTSLVIVFLGVFIAVLGWVMGRSRAARGLRRSIDGMNATGRRQLASRGFDTGAFGMWLGRQRILVRSIIAVLAVVWLFALRPLSVGDILLVVIVSFGVAWILELLQRRPEELAIVAAPLDEPVLVDAAAGSAVDPGASAVVVTDDDLPTAGIVPEDASPTLDLTAETMVPTPAPDSAGALPGAAERGGPAAASPPPKGKSP